MSSRLHVVSTTLSLALVTILSFTSLNTALAAGTSPERDWSITAGPVEPVRGRSLASQITLHRRPSSGAPVVATLHDIDDDRLLITGASGDFVHVDYDGYDGWASLHDVAPATMALVLDPATGATVARVPVGFDQTSVAFSRDGSRAVFFGSMYGDVSRATEVRTSDFAPLRSLRIPGSDTEDADVLCDMFYGGPDGALYAALSRSAEDSAERLAIVRVGDAGAPLEKPVFEGSGMAFTASPDARVGFVMHPIEYTEDWTPKGVTVDVVDLGDFSVRATWTLTGELASAFNGFNPSYEGSELALLANTSRILVVDAATGKVAREIPTGFAEVEDAALRNVCSGGRSLLVWAEGCTENVPEGTRWITGATVVDVPEDELSLALDTGTARYAVDGAGERLVALGAGSKAARSMKIERPDQSLNTSMLFATGLVASPNGARLILIVSEPNEECGC